MGALPVPLQRRHADVQPAARRRIVPLVRFSGSSAGPWVVLAARGEDSATSWLTVSSVSGAAGRCKLSGCSLRIRIIPGMWLAPLASVAGCTGSVGALLLWMAELTTKCLAGPDQLYNVLFVALNVFHAI